MKMHIELGCGHTEPRERVKDKGGENGCRMIFKFLHREECGRLTHTLNQDGGALTPKFSKYWLTRSKQSQQDWWQIDFGGGESHVA
jgi:hypothetical protein